MRASSMCDPDKLSQRAYEDVNGSSTTMYSYNHDQCKRQHFHLCASTEFACMGSHRLFVPFNQRRVQWKKQTCIRYRSSFRVFEVEVSQLCKTVTVAIITYANVSSCTPKRLRIVALHLWHQLSNVEVALRAIEIPHICQDFFGQHDDFSVHRGIKKTGHNIADELLHASIEKESWISVLTGWDQMWEMMNKWNLHI